MIIFVLIRRWWSWIAVQFNRAQRIYCLNIPMDVIMEVPDDPEADAKALAGHPAGAETDLRLMASRAGRARVRIYACGGCPYGHE